MITVLHAIPTRDVNIPYRQNEETFNIKVDDMQHVFMMEMEIIYFDIKNWIL